jgi:glyoxylase-like metal-dependent hydrolase (beta-lactamase superfamily II)
MENWQFKAGLQEIGTNTWAYLQPDGSWCWSNAGLIADEGKSLLVDTLFDLPLTEKMLKEMRNATPAARQIDLLVNTHANGDHTHGNQLVTGARILATRETAQKMAQEHPSGIESPFERFPPDTEAGKFVRRILAPFDFAGLRNVNHPPVDEIFVAQRTVHVGNKIVEMIDVGPAHTASDLLVFVPSDKIVYTGDIMFVGGHPAIWAGPVANWIAACDLILSRDVEAVVPGHGSICTKQGVRRFREYLVYIHSEAKKRYDAGMDFIDAAFDIDLSPVSDWGDSERMVVNTWAIYGEFSGKRVPLDRYQIYELMAKYDTKRRRRKAASSPDALVRSSN